MAKPPLPHAARLAWILCGLTLLFLTIWVLATPKPLEPQPVTTGAIDVGGPFNLVDHNGKKVTEKSWPGQYLLVYFGFTHCPDICPLGLSKLSEALRKLPNAQQKRIQPLFVTVDPARDDAKSLKAYVPLFYPRLLGLTGSEAEIEKIKTAYRVYAQKDGDGPDYMVNHSSFTYLMTPKGKLAMVFSHDADAETMASEMTRFLNAGKN